MRGEGERGVVNRPYFASIQVQVALKEESEVQRLIILLMLLFWVVPAGAVPSNDVEITLQRIQQAWGGPLYTVTIYGDGRVVFDTGKARAGFKELLGSDVVAFRVMFPGRHESRIAPERVAEIVAEFDRVKFFELRDEYKVQPPGLVADQDINRLSIRVQGKYKSVLDDAGDIFGMPPAVTELMIMIDRTASTHRWIGGNPGILAEHIARHGVDTPDNAGRLVLALARRDQEMMRALITTGMPLDYKDPYGMFGMVGQSLYMEAIISGWTDVFVALDQRMPPPRVDRASVENVFALSGGCSLYITRRLVAQGFNPTTARGNDNISIVEAAGRRDKGCPDSKERRLSELATMGAQ
ncbi:DUF6438 domain-containing protein [Niveispirillum cyanobacteriorum]|uniref:DUF6438 domain-containing protein n=1 Tax=Niveispirillum cyanobacteriorum TaxID=1612173 RepID=A0A2K9N8U5_9PROT|nr:DUF6438 domain-containing protein [Niveispirillum cyanobacteriorum]AUN29571.1 hypothetical protein C0V82_04510 [Niveispirillum cyanobacteriorum]GGE63107.1 hypothetical protein GCM10011317_20720 [Niveispirillum cyanobacteriorum]